MKFSWKKSFWVICKSLGLPGNNMTADGKYSLLNRDNFRQQIQMQLSKKKSFSKKFCWFLKSRSNFWLFEKEMIFIGYVFPKLRTAKYVVRKVSKNARFRRRFNKQHVKRSQTLSKSSQQHLYDINWSIWMKFI